jgi:hypothetical protein
VSATDVIAVIALAVSTASAVAAGLSLFLGSASRPGAMRKSGSSATRPVGGTRSLRYGPVH